MLNNKPTILFISDDYHLPSGVGVMTKEIIYGTVKYFNYVHIGVALNHPDKGKIIDCSEEVKRETGVQDASVILYPYHIYGDMGLYRHIMSTHKIDALMHFTDPRQYEWLYNNEHEIRQQIPIIYYNIWDCPPIPAYNRFAYLSCDLLLNISKQTHALVEGVLCDRFTDINWEPNKSWCKYVPHGVDPNIYRPLQENEIDKLRVELFRNNKPSFIALWNNRNQRRKHPGNVILSFRQFLNNVPEQDRKNCYLLLHTQPMDDNGTNLFEIRDRFMKEYKTQVLFHVDRVPSNILNQLYNLADVTINVASNEGFGLSSLESIMAGTMVINNVTGGLQDQMRFVDENNKWIKQTSKFPTNSVGYYEQCGEWALPVFPTSRSLVGSIPTPYIYDETYDNDDITKQLLFAYELSRSERRQRGIKGREWVMSDEANMTNEKMCNSFVSNITQLLKTWKPKERYVLVNSNIFKNYIDIIED